MVAGSAALFGVALFGRRPIPQSATAGTGAVRAANPETQPARRRVPATQVLPGTEPVITLTAADVRVSAARRLRSAVLLAVSALGMALLVGAVLSIAVVVLVFLIV